ncbi:TldD/PmbA family protein [Clostridium pasteurianum]|uniref:Putative Zn-dependent protease-like protein n=1 Tax=Clostridium pasteurianum BC1 TaxID=86416 RepID=R4JY60_CLOPA|nr:TldD/PmbA family protein [Clostridium pasteurianum]AGK95223.1 putative Zn-dependent protease-like protein [Clostridium pasteurianum BC1]
MKVKISNFLLEKKSMLKKLIDILSIEFKYVSVLGTDSFGKQYLVQKTGISVEDSFWNERGFVVRVYNDIGYSEYSFNDIDAISIEKIAKNIKTRVNNQIEKMRSSVNITSYPIISEEEISKSFLGDVEIPFEKISDKEIIGKLTGLNKKAALISEFLIDCKFKLQQVHVSKIFITNKKKLSQSYVWSEGYIFPITRKEENTKFNFCSFSGLKGAEILEEMDSKVDETVDMAVRLLDAKPLEPGEYDAVCSPDVSGIIAHEAFGHGVEMDMFVKNRAKAREYIDKPVASPIVTMRDGAASAMEVSSYLFDDEGILGGDTTIIKNGILKTGICDLLSSLRLGIKPTGNGKRQSFERKVYTRMTNTFFENGTDKLEDMIASIKYGYFLDCPTSGMEDPKNWGIQCMVNYGLEIKDGKFTGNIVSPVVMTGYVPDLLKSISMVSDEAELKGSGACGKGYKEFVKVSSGGPYIKARVRLG